MYRIAPTESNSCYIRPRPTPYKEAKMTQKHLPACTCGETAPPTQTTLASGDTLPVHHFIDRDGQNAGAGGVVCTSPTIVFPDGRALPRTTTFSK